MNLHRAILPAQSRLTSKGQVTIPKEIRDALGLEAGDLVSFVRDGLGARIERPENTELLADRESRIMAGIMEARRLFKEDNCLPEGMTSTEWYEMMRGPPAEV